MVNYFFPCVKELNENRGLLAEYFAPFDVAQSCDPVNGSTQVGVIGMRLTEGF